MRILLTTALLLLANSASAENCAIDLQGNDMMKFDKATVTVSASCKTIVVKLTHSGKLPVTAMGHNVVISTTANLQPVAQDGMKAGAPLSYVMAGDKRVVAFTKLIGGGASTTVSFPGKALKAGGDYSFFCSFPGHWAIMKGKLIVQ